MGRGLTESWNEGDRIKMVYCDDEYSPIETGDMGTVYKVYDFMDMLGVMWDSGRTLNVCLDVDLVVKVG